MHTQDTHIHGTLGEYPEERERLRLRESLEGNIEKTKNLVSFLQEERGSVEVLVKGTNDWPSEASYIPRDLNDRVSGFIEAELQAHRIRLEKELSFLKMERGLTSPA